MSNLLNQLQDAAEAALNSSSMEEGLQHLAKAFSLFSEETSCLKANYTNLQRQYLSVNKELEKTHLVLKEKIAELSRTTEYLNNVLKNIAQGILFIDLEGYILTCNEAACKILNVCEQELLSRKYSLFFKDDFLGFSLKDALDFGLSQRLSYVTLDLKQQDKKEIEVSTSFVFEGPKEGRGMVILLRDITETQQLQLIANRNDRMKELGEMAASVAHEIRNPLGGIRGYATLLYRDLAESKNLQEMASYIIDGTKTLDRLVSNVLQYARPIQIQTKSIDLAMFMRKLTKFIQVDPAYPRNVDVQLHISEEPLITPIDTDALRSALLNLFMNAFHAMEEGGTVMITLMKNNQYALITISDTGRGIEQQDLDQIFSPFFTTKKKGNGLGLSETQKIIQAHLGSIEVRSQKDRGTTFSISLPTRR